MPSSYAKTAVSRFQPRIPASLYEIAWQYSLFDWYDSVQSDAIDWGLDPEHLPYLTPRAKDGLFGEPDSLIVVYADLSDPDNPSFRTEADGGAVELTTYTEADRFRVGHSYPQPRRGKMMDHSITTYKNASAELIAGRVEGKRNTIQDRFTIWASKYGERVRDEVSDADAAILDGLIALGEDEMQLDTIADSLLGQVEQADEELDALITVAVRTPDREEYRLPGEIPVLNEVMAAKKSDRMDSTGVSDASGEATGFVTGEETTVTGGSSGLFGMNSKKQREHVPRLVSDGSSVWRSRPVSYPVAAAIISAESLFDSFSRGLPGSGRLYLLPYLAARREDVSEQTFEWFYDRVYKRIQTADGGADGAFDDVIESIFVEIADVSSGDEEVELPFEEAPSAWDQVRFAAVLQVSGNPDRVYFETLDAVSPALRLEDAHNEIVRYGAAFTPGGVFDGSPPSESSPLLGRGGLNLTQYILYGGYFARTTEPTRSSREASERPTAGDIDDNRTSRVRRLLSESQIDTHRLLEEYIHQIVQDQRTLFGEDNVYAAFPKRSVVEQYSQIHALGALGVLDDSTTVRFDTIPMANDNDSDTALDDFVQPESDGETGEVPEDSPEPDTAEAADEPVSEEPVSEEPVEQESETRESRLEAFISGHSALDDDEQEAIFVLGGLVGRISAYQNYENVSSTLIRRYPVDYLTKQTIKEVTKEVLQMNNSYAEADESRSYQTNTRYTTRLTGTMLAADPEEWHMTQTEIQWLYSLGITYGLSDYSNYTQQDDEQGDETDSDATDN
ncbi:TM1802 family CRISPR-associated protein [Halorubrum sp. Atlit-26R]|uniref:TM1802 family CRISPR-associated protein n=1 Tax=Halorubrum sp. Atlit-26R TaxID=2282128 RepID=UPI001F380D85|nr:TM1802 family CRISPR-associated protein [Halorubrum sp. Atlit-26R]